MRIEKNLSKMMKQSVIYALILMVTIVSCDKREGINPCDDDNPENLPKVSTKNIVDNGTSLNINYEITDIGNPNGDGITHHGVCWSSSNSNPTISDNKTDKGATTSTGTFTESVLKSALSYDDWYFRSYATNCAGTSYGEVLIYDIAPVPEMIFVQGGTFVMGCTGEQNDNAGCGEGDCYSNECPTHNVTLSDYYIGNFEVTQAEWEKVMGDNSSHHKCTNCPVEYIDWYSTIVYCNEKTKGDAEMGESYRVYYKDSAMTDAWDIDDYNGNGGTGIGEVYIDWSKSGYRLPTEAEWEYAARGGNNGSPTKYSGSDKIADVAWYYSNSGSKNHEVGGKDANELGIYDMTGNVWEWCSDWYGNYTSGSFNNPHGGANGSYRVFRGGGWSSNAQHCRVANRNSDSPSIRYYGLGFRLAQSL